MKCKNCGDELFVDEREICHYCERKEIMELSDETLADELTRGVFYYKKDWDIRETLRRLLLRGNKNEME